MGSQLKEMLKGALRRISTMKTVTLGKVDKVESEASYPKLSILKKVFLTLNVKMKKGVKVSSGFKRNSRKVGGFNYQKSKVLSFLNLIKAHRN